VEFKRKNGKVSCLNKKKYKEKQYQTNAGIKNWSG